MTDIGAELSARADFWDCGNNIPRSGALEHVSGLIGQRLKCRPNLDFVVVGRFARRLHFDNGRFVSAYKSKALLLY